MNAERCERMLSGVAIAAANNWVSLPYTLTYLVYVFIYTYLKTMFALYAKCVFFVNESHFGS